MRLITDETTPYELPFEAYGAELRLCASSPQLLARTEAVMPPGWRPCAPTEEQEKIGILEEDDGTYSVFKGRARVSESQGLELSLMMLDGQLRGHVAMNAPGRTFIHAGAVAHGGRALIFPGHSFAGKSTLVAALVRAGAVYYSDEFAVLDAEGLVHPYAKPLSLRDDPVRSQVETRVEELGGTAGIEPLPLGLAVFTYYKPGAEFDPEPIPPGAAALELVSHTVTVRARPQAAMRAISRALEGATALKGKRGDAAEIADRLLASVPA